MMITLYQQHDSGNCYKVRLVLTHLRLSFQTIAVSSVDGSTRRPDFLAKNPIGKVPTVQLDDGRYLAESNAILLHLAEGTTLLPADAYDRAKVYEWLFFEQYNHEPSIAVRRALSVYPERRTEATPERMARLLEAGSRALAVMGASAWRRGLARRRGVLDRRHFALRLHSYSGRRRVRFASLSGDWPVAEAGCRLTATPLDPSAVAAQRKAAAMLPPSTVVTSAVVLSATAWCRKA